MVCLQATYLLLLLNSVSSQVSTFPDKRKETRFFLESFQEKCLNTNRKNNGNAQPIVVTKTTQVRTHSGSYPVICK